MSHIFYNLCKGGDDPNGASLPETAISRMLPTLNILADHSDFEVRRVI